MGEPDPQDVGDRLGATAAAAAGDLKAHNTPLTHRLAQRYTSLHGKERPDLTENQGVWI